MSDAPTARERARALVLAHGWNAMAYQLLNPGFSRWFAAAGDAVVGYVTWGRTRVVAGAPVCDGPRVAAVAHEFAADARAHGERVTWFAAGERLEALYARAHDHAFLPLGSQPWWDAREWDATVRGRKSLREQVARARNKGVTVAEWPADRAHESPALRDVLHAWLATRGLPPLHFLVEPDTLGRLGDRRVLVASRGDAVLAFLVATPIPARRAWLIEQWPRRPGAPNGTVELLIDAAMRALGTGDAPHVTLGLAPLSVRAPHAALPDGRTLAPWLRLALHWAHMHGARFYDFDGLDAFKAKFAPARWEPLFAIVDAPRVHTRHLWAIAGTFGRRSPLGLGLLGLARAAREELRRLGAR